MITGQEASTLEDDNSQNVNQSAKSEDPSPDTVPTGTEASDKPASHPQSLEEKIDELSRRKVPRIERHKFILGYNAQTAEDRKYQEKYLKAFDRAISTAGGASPSQPPDEPDGEHGEEGPPSQPPDEQEGAMPPTPPNQPTTENNPDEPDRPFRDAWIGFVRSLRTLITGSIADRPRYIDQFLQWATAVLNAAESAAIADRLQEAYNEAEHRSRDLLLKELLSINQAVAVAAQTEPQGEKSTAAGKNLLRIGKTVVDSIKDIFAKFLENHPLVKGILTLLGEVLDIFRGE
jgi:hypothetical protein